MKLRSVWFMIFLLLHVSFQTFAGEPAIIPRPVSIQMHKGTFRITQKTPIIITSGNIELVRLAHVLQSSCEHRLGTSPEIVASDSPKAKRVKGIHVMILDSSEIPECGKEGYRLIITRKRVQLSAQTPAGIFYGIQSLLQLLPVAEKNPPTENPKVTRIPCMDILDFPRFPYRGLHLDVCRHFFPVSFIKQYLDIMARYKLNTFHWHLTDDQGWRIEIKQYPALVYRGAQRKGTQIGKTDLIDKIPYGGWFTQDEIKEVVGYAAERGITVIPEIEMPGHCVAALTAYPRFSCTGGPFEVRTTWGVSEDVFCAGKDSTFLFLENILDEVMALFPSTNIHIGGDEVPKSRWKACALCQQRMKEEGLKDEHELQSYFIRRIEKYVNAQGKKIIGWDEILEGGLAPEATVMSWQGTEGGIEAARMGHDVIMTPGSHCYFDHYQADPAYEPLAIGGFTPLKKVYAFEPVPAVLSEIEAKHILGAQGNLWSEYIEKGDHVLYMAYPRALALAEVTWSPAASRDWKSFTTRLEPHFTQMEREGIPYCNSLYDVDIATSYDTIEKGMAVLLSADWQHMDIRYTTDGSIPGPASTLYSRPFFPAKSCIVKAASFSDMPKGRVNQKEIFVHKAYGKPVSLLMPPHAKYPGIGPMTLTDGIKGSLSLSSREWLGYQGKDIEAVIDMESAQTIEEVTVRFLKNIYSWIFLPESISFFVSTDGITFLPQGSVAAPSLKEPGREIREFSMRLDNNPIRYVKIIGHNPGVCPPWHEAAGQPCWIFIDEVVIK